MSNYDTLNISLQTDNKRYESRISKTIDVDQRSDDQEENGENQYRVRKFRQLYYRNEKLRKQLKNLNEKLNERLDKVKFPSVKKRAASVDLNHVPPSKALVRELQNATKQVKMYKKQVEILKIKEETPQNYQKIKNMQNAIAYKDIQIAQVQKDLVSIKNVKKLQEKKIIADLENEEVKERLDQYLRQHKQLKEKLKAIAKQSRKKEQVYRKQQAYAIAIEKKLRDVEKKIDQEDDQFNKKQQEFEQYQRPNRQISQVQFKNLKQELEQQKAKNDSILKKIEIQKKVLLKEKKDCHETNEKFKEKDAFGKKLQTKIQALHRLIKEQQRREKTPPKNKLITKIEQLQFDDEERNSEENHHRTVSKDDASLRKMLNEMNQLQDQQERNWKGKYRKVQNGFGSPTDTKFQLEGQLAGFKVSLDEDESICGLVCIFQDKNGFREEKVQGKRSNVELTWTVQQGDKISKIYGSFTQQSYLSELVVVSKKGKSGVFGSRAQDSFSIEIKKDERISGCFGSVRQLGKDKRITELGFWIERTQ